MFATFPRTRIQRRGVVLILVLGMLGLLALIGVTFATFSGQVKVNSRNFSQAQNWPESSEMMDYALAQLIDDTDNPQSAIRGHSLKNDMYGNDARYNSALSSNPANGVPFQITAVTPIPTTVPPSTFVNVLDVDGTSHQVAVDGLIQIATNIAAPEPALYGYNFTRWIMKFPPVVDNAATPVAAYYVGETHEILADVNISGLRVFYVAPHDNSYGSTTDVMPTPVVPTEAPVAPTYFSQAPTIPYPLPVSFPAGSYTPDGTPTNPPIQNYNYYNYNYVSNAVTTGPGQSTLIGLNWRYTNRNAASLPANFTLDGRFLHAFNGPGVSALNPVLSDLTLNLAAADAAALSNRGMAQFGNFRTNGNILAGNFATNPFQTSSAYGSPTNLGCGMDEDYDACDLENWFLAMQSGDSQIMIPSFHRPGILVYDSIVKDPITGVAPYDDWKSKNVFSASKILRPRAVDGHDANTFKPLYPNASGKITYDVDNDGDGTTDSVWLDLGYPPRRNTDGRLFKPLFAFMIIGLNGRIPLNTAGNLQLRTLLDPVTGTYGLPMGAHASSKGFSPSEIDPTYALQNAFIEGSTGTTALYAPLDNAGTSVAGRLTAPGVYLAGDNSDNSGAYTNSQWWGNAGVPVSLTQLRNLLAGTRSPAVYKNAMGIDVPLSDDQNFVVVNGKPMYLPNGVMDIADVIHTGPPPYSTTTSDPIAGRWGEPADQPIALTGPAVASTVPQLPGWPFLPPTYYYQNQVRAGVSGQWVGTAPRYGDARDDNYNAFDWYPSNLTGATTPTNSVGGAVITTLGENADFLDPSGSLALPVERLRRFVTPIDVMGDGLVNNFKTPVGTTVTLPIGADDYGRVAFLKHFRPPGLLLATPPGLALPTAPLVATAPGTPTSFIWYPYGSNSYWEQGIGKPAPPLNKTPVSGQIVPVDLTNNLYRGFESYRRPLIPAGLSTVLMGGMPSNNIPPLSPPNDPWVPTYDQFVNTSNSSANLNEADEMQLYNPHPADQPFGAADLEWLYRQQDTDGVSLASRLKDLAPVSFTNPRDGSRRRRLFSIESWEPTNFVWAHDNPANDLEWPTVTSVNAPYGNTWFYASPKTLASSSIVYPSMENANLSTESFLRSQRATFYDANAASTAYTVPRKLPSLAHRDRKINLNFPLPISNRYDEPVRQKWIRETYQLLKQILPPKAVDTPEELAQLSQYVVNIIDFRDPDGTATRFVNTDVYYTKAAVATPGPTQGPATLAFTPSGGVGNASLGPPWRTNPTSTPPPDYSPLYDNVNSPYLVQYGMEYNPVAITEVLALNYTSKTTGALAPRMWVELANTLTVPAAGPMSDPTACNLSLDGWDFIILPDDPTGRPDPFTGQLPLTTLPQTIIPPASIQGVTTSDQQIMSGITVDPGGLTTPIPAIPASGTPTGYLIQDRAPNADDSITKAADATIDLVGKTMLTSATPGQFYWLYLRRPANPFDTTYDPARPNENRVVVDAFRFIYNTSKGVGSPPGDTVTGSPAAGDLFSMQRLQPFRGGHAVAPIPALAPGVAPNYCLTAYGYSEQTSRATSAANSVKMKYGMADLTGDIYNTLGTVAGGATNDYDWEYFQFNDRDFTSVAELLMVPGCPPGLFTKQFVEVSSNLVGVPPLVTPPLAGFLTGMETLPSVYKKPTTAPAAGSPLPPPVGTAMMTAPTTSQPRTFPYLMDEFFYTAQSEPAPPYLPTAATVPVAGQWPDPASGPAPIHQPSNFNPSFPITAVGTPDPLLSAIPHYIGGPSQAGWFRMFEFLDVPSPANGSIGTVAQGTNYDWARQDLKPGLLNINLIADEEVFFSVMSESWLKTLGYVRNIAAAPYSPGQEDLDNMGDTRLNVQQISDANTPLAVTQVNFYGTPTSTVQMANQGFMALDPLLSFTNGVPYFGNRMKAAFSDFLKLRHGGSGYLFAHQSGNVGDPNTTLSTTQLAAERPYHSFAYPDINYTLMRPATLPPTTSTPYAPWLPSWAKYVANRDQFDALAPFPTYIGDPGVKNPYLFTQNNPVQPPPIPPRRLFQLPDVWGNIAIGMPPAGGLTIYPSNASPWMTAYPVGGTKVFSGDPYINWQNPNSTSIVTNNLVNVVSDISAYPSTALPNILLGVPTPAVVPNFYLGANTTGAQNDNRQHPAFRYDWLHKVTNLTTVRTHQYAVWITVGFFEVTKQGDPALGNTAPDLAHDHLGAELNIQNGTNIRYRSFFIIDRTRAVGFSPQAPGNFRECIVYRQPIE
ncbi:hypothetical protein SAMN05444166_2535 [Singulisphaera sp. GP187]|uniref:hypothetical protein n=1 Tax=Singulisphaera sp. GP187 TaxID=1882752 RepID=UPI00092A9A8A|nr:hypothetical protein [Singulisphaera sp. GP187]SIO11677.1 hypothetical protein SAMN05444166_2535 [Singulisphaera sp. GP187]